jgi:hypothetical protein
VIYLLDLEKKLTLKALDDEAIKAQIFASATNGPFDLDEVKSRRLSSQYNPRKDWMRSIRN